MYYNQNIITFNLIQQIKNNGKITMNDNQRSIYHYLITQIAEEKLAVGDRIPTENELANKFNTSRMTAHKAVKAIEAEGLVRRNKKQGTIVNNFSTTMANERKHISANCAHVIASLDKAQKIHWNETTLIDLESIMAENERKLYYEKLPHDPQKKDLQNILNKINEASSSAIVFLPDRGESEFLLKNLDVILNYKGDIYLLDRGAISLDDWPFHRIQFDTFNEGVQAARFLYERAHKNIFLISAEYPQCKGEKTYWEIKREKGLELELSALSEYKTKLKKLSFPRKSYSEQVVKYIKKSKKKLTIVAATDQLSAEIIDTAGQANMSAPTDFDLLSFDNNPAYRNYQITTIAPPVDRVGKTLGKLICKKHELFDINEKISVRLLSEVIERNTCGNYQIKIKQ